MSRAVYLGDEAHAAGWRLAGVDVRIADAGADLVSLFDAARVGADLVLLSETTAARLPGEILDQARRALKPLLLVLPGPVTLHSGSELARRVRGALGMEA